MATRKEDFSFQRRLEQEIELWLKEGLIAPDQKGPDTCTIQSAQRSRREGGTW